jgi:hypothetical protein
MKALVKRSIILCSALLIVAMLQSCFGGYSYCPSYGEGKKINPRGLKAQKDYIKRHRKDQRR